MSAKETQFAIGDIYKKDVELEGLMYEMRYRPPNQTNLNGGDLARIWTDKHKSLSIFL